MAEIIEQLELNQTFFVQFALFVVVFVVIGNLYFKPFLKLFQARHKKTVADKEAAEALLAEANAKFEEYRRKVSEERADARKLYDLMLADAKREEEAILANAREEAKKITQEAMDSAQKQKEQITQSLQSEVESLAKSISESLLSRKP